MRNDNGVPVGEADDAAVARQMAAATAYIIHKDGKAV